MVFSEVIVRDKSGKVSAIRLMQNFYGDLMGDYAQAAVQAGCGSLVYFGTAGGLGTGLRVGDVHVPSEILDPENRRANPTVPNAFQEVVQQGKADERVRVGTRLGNVHTLALEDMKWLDEATNQHKLNAVEVEISHLATAAEAARAKGRAVDLHAAVILSDVPGTEDTIAKPDSGARETSFKKMIDHYLKVLGVHEALFQKKETPVERGQYHGEAHVARALKMAEEQGLGKIHTNNYYLLRHSIAGEILAGMTPEAILKGEAIPDAVKKKIAGLVKSKSKFKDFVIFDLISECHAAIGVALVAVPGSEKGVLKFGGDFAAGRLQPTSVIDVALTGVDGALIQKFQAALAEKTSKIRTVADGERSVPAQEFRLDPHRLFLEYRRIMLEKHRMHVYIRPDGGISFEYAGSAAAESLAIQ